MIGFAAFLMSYPVLRLGGEVILILLATFVFLSIISLLQKIDQRIRDSKPRNDLGRAAERVKILVEQYYWKELIALRMYFFYAAVVSICLGVGQALIDCVQGAQILENPFELEFVVLGIVFFVASHIMTRNVKSIQGKIDKDEATEIVDDLYKYLRQGLGKTQCEAVLHSMCSVMEKNSVLTCLVTFASERKGTPEERGEEIARIYLWILADLDIRIYSSDKEYHSLLKSMLN